LPTRQRSRRASIETPAERPICRAHGCSEACLGDQGRAEQQHGAEEMEHRIPSASRSHSGRPGAGWVSAAQQDIVAGQGVCGGRELCHCSGGVQRVLYARGRCGFDTVFVQKDPEVEVVLASGEGVWGALQQWNAGDFRHGQDVQSDVGTEELADAASAEVDELPARRQVAIGAESAI